MRLTLHEAELRLRNSTTRIPFRYGTANLTRCPQVIVRVRVCCDGAQQDGFSGDCLPPSWFDKSPEKNFARQIAEMLQVIRLAQDVYLEEFGGGAELFRAWRSCDERIHRQCDAWMLPPLLASFGSSLLERAVLDAVCRRHQVSFAQALRANLFGIDAAAIHPELDGLAPGDWLPAEPLRAVHVRQTVGLADPLTADEIPAADRLEDGWPQAIEEYATRRGVRYYKVKVSNRLEADLDRLARLARVLESHLGTRYRVTLDGNEQYKQAAQFEELIETIRSHPDLDTLWRNTLAIEQPFDRAIALDAARVGGLAELSRSKPVIIDESDGTLHAYREALELGYRGVSSKNCKGAIRAILNAGLTWVRNGRGARHDYLMTAEDLCTVGIVPVQSDLCLAATIGLEHVERNGHHYHPGLRYLPEPQRRAALSAHPDFYTEEHGIIGPHIQDGQFRIASLQCSGFGFAVVPDVAAMEPAESWRFESLGV